MFETFLYNIEYLFEKIIKVFESESSFIKKSKDNLFDI